MFRLSALLTIATLALALLFVRFAEPDDFAPTCDAGPELVLAATDSIDPTLPTGPLAPNTPVTCWQCELINWLRCWRNPNCTLVPCAFICP